MGFSPANKICNAEDWAWWLDTTNNLPRYIPILVVWTVFTSCVLLLTRESLTAIAVRQFLCCIKQSHEYVLRHRHSLQKNNMFELVFVCDVCGPAVRARPRSEGLLLTKKDGKHS